jgi:hypothetical protein
MRLPRVWFTVRQMMALVALLAVLMATYVALVEIPARRRRFVQADQAVAIQIGFFRRAAAVERQRERAEAERAAKNRGLAETDEPARAALWSKAADGALGAARRAARKADEYQKAADDLVSRRLKAGSRLAGVEQLGALAASWLASDDAPDETFPFELRTAKLKARLEHEAKAGGRSMFPTVAGPRASVIEAAAIWQAEKFIGSTRGAGIRLNAFQATAQPLSPDQPFYWHVKFVDPRTGQTYECRTSFSEPTIRDYLAKNP